MYKVSNLKGFKSLDQLLTCALDQMKESTKQLIPTNQFDFFNSILPKGGQSKSVYSDRQLVLMNYEAQRIEYNRRTKQNIDLYTFICIKEDNLQLDLIAWLRMKIATFNRFDYYKSKGNYSNNKKIKDAIK